MKNVLKEEAKKKGAESFNARYRRQHIWTPLLSPFKGGPISDKQSKRDSPPFSPRFRSSYYHLGSFSDRTTQADFITIECYLEKNVISAHIYPELILLLHYYRNLP